MKFPTKKYSIIYAEPPWRYSDSGCHGNAERHYSTMTFQEICDLPVADIAKKDCALFLWATYPLLIEALEVISSWGFSYKSIAFQWVKLNPKSKTPFYGLGRWTRGNTEPCLIATKGKPRRKANDVFQLIQTPRGRHSAKPSIVRTEIVRLMGDVSRIELFARIDADILFDDPSLKGWDIWGNETGKR